MKFDIPVVLFVHKRPKQTQLVLNRLAELCPSRLYVFGDGPRTVEEEKLCEATRQLFDDIPWRCKLITGFLTSNVGTASRFISGLDLVFSMEESAIILEDDCLPSLSFFAFAKELLARYNSDDEVMHINGTNLLDNSPLLENYEHSYFFTKFSIPSWGWATWANSWEKFNRNLDTWQIHKRVLFSNFQQKNFSAWTNLFKFHREEYALWDVEWNLDIWNNQGLVVVPVKNMVSNIGFGEGATFTHSIKSKYANKPIVQFNEQLLHPSKKILWEHSNCFEDEVINFINECTTLPGSSSKR